MKLFNYVPKILFICCLLFLYGCGQKGDLTLPDDIEKESLLITPTSLTQDNKASTKK